MGILYIVATPIGNLKDITLRALEVLRGVDLIVCEDTRQTIKLLNRYQIKKPLVSYFQHSKLSKVEYIAGQLKQGKKMALVTDAGTPGISDPGGKLIELVACRLPHVTLVPIPGPNAAIAALSASGFPADKFFFMGFPPHKKGRNKFFDEAVNAKYTAVFYESSHRISKTLKELLLRVAPSRETRDGAPKQSRAITADADNWPGLPRSSRDAGFVRNDRQIVVCRELTKMFESIYRGTAEEIIKILESDKNNLRGEFVILIHGQNG